MPNLMEEFMKDAVSPAPVSNTQLEEISKLAEMQLALEQEVERQEAILAGYKENLRRVVEVAIPEAMASVGMSSFTMTDGSKLTVTESVFASVRKEKVDAAFYWLDKHGLGDIIKDEIKVSLGRGEYETAEGIKEALHAVGAQFDEKLSVHPGTLSATIKEQRQKGLEFPEELFSGTLPVKKSVIKKPKKGV